MKLSIQTLKEHGLSKNEMRNIKGGVAFEGETVYCGHRNYYGDGVTETGYGLCGIANPTVEECTRTHQANLEANHPDAINVKSLGCWSAPGRQTIPA